MAYIRSNIVVRPAYAGVGDALVSELGGVLDSIGTFLKNTVNAYGETKKAQGAAQATVAAQTPVMAPSSGISTTTVLAAGALGVGALLLLKKRKKK